MANLMQERRDDLASWTSLDPVIPDGQLVLERVGLGAGSSFKLKVGNGVDAYNVLAYFAGAGGSGGGALDFFFVTDYGADKTGVSDSTAAFNTAIATCITAGGGVVWIPAGTYLVSGVINRSPLVSMLGIGAGVVKLKCPSGFTGTMILWNLGPFTGANSRPLQSGKLDGFTIDGTGCGNGAVGLEYGDAIDGCVGGNLLIQNFTATSAKGIYANNRTNYTEGTWWDCLIDNCTTCILFDNQSGADISHGYQFMKRMRFTGINSGQVGLSSINAALLYNGSYDIAGNLAPGGTLMTLTGAGGGMDGHFCIRAEQTPGTPGLASGIIISSFAHLMGSGTVALASNFLQSSITAGHGTFKISGRVEAPGLSWNGEVASTIGGTGWGAHGGTTPPFTNSWVQDGGTLAFKQNSDGDVQLQGAVKNGSSAGSAAFQLPVGYRPPETLWFPVPTNFGASTGVVAIDTNGFVYCPNTSQTSLSGIVFTPLQG